MIVAWLIFSRRLSHDYHLKVAGVVQGADRRAWERAKLAIEEEKKQIVESGFVVRAVGMRQEKTLTP